MMNVGMVGVGCISGIYLKNFAEVFKDVRLVAVCDLIRERAEQAQEKYNIPKLYDTMEELFADPEIDIVLNLTRPYQHYAVSKAALLAGKHVYSEKPLGADWEEGTELVRICGNMLEEAQLQIEKVVKGPDGNPTFEEFKDECE